MNLRSIENKSIRTTADGERYVDMLGKTFSVNQDVKIEGFVRLKSYHEMNPAAIAYDIYGSTKYFDAILKINEISDPFSLKEGDILFYIPESQLKSFYIRAGKNADKLKERVKENARTSTKDESRKEYLEKKKGNAEENLPTNLLRDGESVFKFQNGVIKLG